MLVHVYDFHFIPLFNQDDVGSPLMCKDSNGIWYIQGNITFLFQCHISLKQNRKEIGLVIFYYT